MASRNFNRKQCLEKEIKDIYLKASYTALVQSSASLATTTAITLTKASGGAANNTRTFKTVINVAAPNPAATVLVAFTGTAAAIVCTVTPNDGTNNTGTPVGLTSAQLRELIATGSVVGVSITLTDLSSLRALQTATGGSAAALVNAGNGDNVTATFAGGVNQAFTYLNRRGVLSLVESNTGDYTITLEDRYMDLKMLNVNVIRSTAVDFNPQIKSYSVNVVTPVVEFFNLVGATPTNFSDGDIILVSLELKNTSVA